MPINTGHAFRRSLLFFSALALAGLATAACLVVHGASASLRLAEQRLGADILVVPASAAASVEAALLTGGPVHAWMSDDYVQRIAAVPGVAAVSPQLYLSSPPLLLVACEPALDPALRPWLSGPAPGSLAPASAVGGSGVAVPAGDDTLWLYGSPIRLAGRLAPTGTHLDHALFLTFETAHDLARQSHLLATRPLELPLTGISAALVRLRPAGDSQAVASAIQQALPGIAAMPRSDLFHTYRGRAGTLAWGMLAALAAAAATLAALLFLPAASHRLTGGAGRLALSGAALGIALAAPSTYLLRGALVAALGLPMQLPSVGWLLPLGAASLAIAAAAAPLRRAAWRHVHFT